MQSKYMYSLNSTMVRLQLSYHIFTEIAIERQSQFHYGSITTKVC